jgi:hypothetical protein
MPIAFVGTEPNPAYDPESQLSRERHEKVVVLSVASGEVVTHDRMEQSTVETE